MLVFKIMRAEEWEALQRDGRSSGAPIDLADGFVHLSSEEQVAETARRHFAEARGLHLLALEAEALGEALRWEPSRGGALFPHLYREIQLDDVRWDAPLPLINGEHSFPPLRGRP